MQAIPAHHTNASIFWPCCAGQSNFQQSQILVNLCTAVKPKASSSCDQNSQSRINYASSKHTQVRSKSSLDKGNQFHIYKWPRLCHYTSFGVYSRNPIPFQYGKYRPLLCILVWKAMFAWFFVVVSWRLQTCTVCTTINIGCNQVWVSQMQPSTEHPVSLGREQL